MFELELIQSCVMRCGSGNKVNILCSICMASEISIQNNKNNILMNLLQYAGFISNKMFLFESN